ncbi:haloacid dehalogenase [Pedobacter frigiditerrae]|uniref:Haloacid dehalogenase n=1 Tax=Pedobacter frigiditerrae TaxID=2530452 RepID=A0A4R0MY97_9SPHI|nr:HAD hydrolase-like protein [Pedobacter frigiditerrae]TCC91877.1 haloacid dehalogenase [Pedobacter frigiditerrae]
MAFEEYIKDKKAIVLGLDNVLYPEKDYLLQVYYLFSEFMAYSEQLDSSKIIEFMQAEFVANGSEGIFEKASSKFNIPDKYKANFSLLHQNARLPLKLLLFKQMLSFLQELVVERKTIFLLVDGDPKQQINKIKQTEWHGLEKYLKVYFTEEFEPKPSSKSINFILNENKVKIDELLMLGISDLDRDFASKIGMEFLSVAKLL